MAEEMTVPEILNRFASISMRFMESSQDIITDGQNYAYFERYDKNKRYGNQPFQQDFGQGLLWYQYVFVEYRIQNEDGAAQLYVCAQETAQNLTEELKSNCQCEACVAIPVPVAVQEEQPKNNGGSWWSWLTGGLFSTIKQEQKQEKSIVCPCCVGCLKSDKPHQWQINRARARMERNRD